MPDNRPVRNTHEQAQGLILNGKQQEAVEHTATLWAFQQEWQKGQPGRTDMERELAWEGFQEQAKQNPALIMQYVHEFRTSAAQWRARVEAEEKEQARQEGMSGI